MAQTHANQGARRAAVAAALATHGRLTYTTRRALAQAFGCAPVTIYNDMIRSTAAKTPITGAPAVLHLTVPSALAADRDVAILRLLGRLEFVTTAMLKPLIAPDVSRHALWARLKRLLGAGYIWRQTVSMAQVQPREAGGRALPPPKAPAVYGLTPEGLELLKMLDVESSDVVYASLQTRDRRAPNVPQAQITHDLLVASWCASAIDGARRSRRLDAIHCQVEYVSARTPDGREQQRMDALLALVFNHAPRESHAPDLLWQVPWSTGEAPHARQQVARYALEVDRGTEPLKVLLAKGLLYRTLTETGHYRQTLGGEVLPVLLVPPGRRAGQIAREWQTSWAGGRGVISTFQKANHAQYGVLWGAYYTLTDTPARLTHLLAGIFPDIAAWEREATER